MTPQDIIVTLPEPGILSELISITQIIANAAVIVAIAIAVLQLRSSQSSASSAAEQHHTQAMNNFWMTLAADDDLALIYRRGRKNPNELTEQHQARFFYACATWFALHEFLFVQSRGAHVSDRYYREWIEALRDDVKDSGFQWYWKKERDFFDSEFAQFLDNLARENEES